MNAFAGLSLAVATGLGVALTGLTAGPQAAAVEPVALRSAPAELPERLSETGLFMPGTTQARAELVSFSPQYPLWSDGATKRRWLYLPPGTAVDASRADAWDFPPGTRLWKEFGYGAAVETRLIERLADGSWRFAAYVWNADRSDATLAPAVGIKDLAVRDAPFGRYAVPSRDDCLACHEGAAVPVLGFSLLQLSPDRDTHAPHSEPSGARDVDLASLGARKLLINLPAALGSAPRIVAPTPTARAALGYLHGNCGHCHNDVGPLALLDLSLAQGQASASATRTLATLLGQPSDFRTQGAHTRVVPGEPAGSVLALRMRSRDPLIQMPPLGTEVVDTHGLEAVERWIRELNFTQLEIDP